MSPETKILKTILSCKTAAQVETTRRMIENYERMFGVSDYSIQLRHDLTQKANGIEKNPI